MGLLLVAVGGCSEGGEPGRGDLPADLDLTGATSIHRVSVGGWGSEERLVPESVEAEVGAIVVFQVADWRVHTIRFLAEEMTAEQVAFMDGRFQTTSPPLVQRETQFVVTFLDAPVGTYPFVAEGFGDGARGTVVIVPAGT